MEAQNAQTAPKRHPAHSTHPNASRSEPNAPTAFFPPLKLEGSRDSFLPLLFPLVPTTGARRILPQALDGSSASRVSDTKINQTANGIDPGNGENDDASKELARLRNSWSYWIGEKAQSNSVLSSEQTEDGITSDDHETNTEKIEVDSKGIQPVYSSLKVRKTASDLGSLNPVFSQECSQVFQGHKDQIKEEKIPCQNPSGKTYSPLQDPTFLDNTSFTPQKEISHKDLSKKITNPCYPPHSYKCSSDIVDIPEFSINNTILEKGKFSGEGTHDRSSRRRSYSLKMNSHEPFRLARSNSWSERQRRGFLPQGPGTTGNTRQPHRTKSTSHPSTDILHKRCSLRRSPSGAAHSGAVEKNVLRIPSGMSSSKSHKGGRASIVLNNSYQPPYNTFPAPERHGIRSLVSNHSTNFSYPRTYLESSNPQIHSISNSSKYNDIVYGERSNVTTLLGHEGSSHRSHEPSVGFMARKDESKEKFIDSKGFHRHIEIYDPAKGTERAQVYENTLINRGPSVQSRSIHKPNPFIPNRPTISPGRGLNYRSPSGVRGRADSRSCETSPVDWRNPKIGLDGEVYDNYQATGYTNPSIAASPLTEAAEIKYADTSGFTSTLDAVSRPYTPDRFVTQVGVAHHNDDITGNRSKSVESCRGTHHRHKQSTNSTENPCAIPRSSSIDLEHHIPRKQTPKLSIWPSLKPTPGMPLRVNNRRPPPPPTPAPAATGIIGAFRERRRIAKELKDAVKHPHTATTRAGPTRGSIRENSSSPPLHPNAYQPDATQTRLNSLAREGKAKYESVAREIKQLLAAQNEPEEAKKIDTPSPLENNQDSTYSGEHIQSVNPIVAWSEGFPQPSAIRPTTKPQTADVDAIQIKPLMPTPRHPYISTVCKEGQRIVEEIWERGIGNRCNPLKNKNSSQRRFRYGSAGKKVKVYMSGARGESLTVLEKIGMKVGIHNPSSWKKGKVAAEVDEKIKIDEESDPLGIDLCGAIDITDRRTEDRNLGDSGEGGSNYVSPASAWKDFEEEKPVDPIKLKLEGEGSKKYWSSKDVVEPEKTFWGKFKKLVTKKVTKSG